MAHERKINSNLQVALYSTIGCISVLFNWLIICVIISRKKMRTKNNLLLVNLALTDMGIIVVGIPPTVINLLTHDVKTTGSLCQLTGLLLLTAFVASNFNLILIAVHRFFLITRNRYYDILFSNTFKLFTAISIVWVSGLLISCPPLFDWGKFAYSFGRAHCMVEWNFSVCYLVFVQVIAFFAPLSVLIFCYYKVIRTTRRSQRRLKASADRHNLSQQLREHRLTIMLILVVICFITCFMPYAILIQTEGLFKIETTEVQSLTAMMFAYSNSIFDFWIYSVMSADFRKALLSLWRFICHTNKVRPTVSTPGSVKACREENRIKISEDAELSERRSYVRRSEAGNGKFRNFYEKDDEFASKQFFVDGNIEKV